MQPVVHKESVHKDDTDEEEPKKRKLKRNNKNKKTTKCPFIVSHQNRELEVLSEEQDVRDLENGYLSGARCSACENIIVNKSKLINEESATETIFNKKWLIFSCENYSASK